MSKRLSRFVSILRLLAFALAGAAAVHSQAYKDVAASSAGVPASAPLAQDPSYRIGPEDVLNVNVWKEPELSATIPVRPDGRISLPLLNDVEAAGKTPMELSKEISDKLKKYVSEPTVTVGVTAINSKRIYVLGQVGRPGTFPLVPNETVLQALTSAGGFQQFANIKKVYVLRKTSKGGTEKLFFNYKKAIHGESNSGDVDLISGDTIVVP